MELTELFDLAPWDWPRGTAKRFLEVLNDPLADPSERLAAAKLAGDFTVINDALAGALLAVLGNPNESEEMRAAAAISFGAAMEAGSMQGFDDPDDVPISEGLFHHLQESLEHYYRDTAIPKLVRRRALEASVRDSQDWHEAALREAYASGDKDWVVTALFGMSYVPGEFEDEIMKSLASRDAEIRFEAVRAAGGREVDAAWPEVVQLINDRRTPKSLRLVAIEAAAEIRPAEARRILQKLTDSKDEDIADAADEAISTAEVLMKAEEYGEDEGDEEEGGWVN